MIGPAEDFDFCSGFSGRLENGDGEDNVVGLRSQKEFLVLGGKL